MITPRINNKNIIPHLLFSILYLSNSLSFKNNLLPSARSRTLFRISLFNKDILISPISFGSIERSNVYAPASLNFPISSLSLFNPLNIFFMKFISVPQIGSTVYIDNTTCHKFSPIRCKKKYGICNFFGFCNSV